MSNEPSPVKPFLDVRTIPPVERHPTIFSLIDHLEPGAAFQIINDHDPRPLHYQLETRYPGAFSWTYMEAGPEVWRVEISRLAKHSCTCGGH